MEAATPLHHPRVRVQGDVLAVDGLTVADETAVRLAREREQAGADVAALVRDAVEIGARVLDREQSAANTDFVRAEFEKAAREVEIQFGERARGVGEALQRQLDAVFSADQGVLTKALEQHFGDGSNVAVQHKVREIVTEVMRGSREEMLKAFTAEDGHNPLTDFKRAQVEAVRDAGDRQAKELRGLHGRLADLQKEVEGLRAERAGEEDVAAERERGTAKGRSYEESVALALERIAAAQGDDAEPVGDQPGPQSKVGDVVVGLDGCRGPAHGRIVFEAKDRRLSRKSALEELDRALENRSADFAVLVVPSEEHLPPQISPLRELSGDKLFVVFNPDEGEPLMLEVAYALARARVAMAREGAERVDTAAVRERVERALTAMEDVKRIKAQLTGAATGIERAKGLVDAQAASVRGVLAEIETIVDAATAAEI